MGATCTCEGSLQLVSGLNDGAVAGHIGLAGEHVEGLAARQGAQQRVQRQHRGLLSHQLVHQLCECVGNGGWRKGKQKSDWIQRMTDAMLRRS